MTVELNQSNSLSSTRIVCSEVNEVARLSNLPKSRSTTLAIQLNSTNSNLSPVLDTQNGLSIKQQIQLLREAKVTSFKDMQLKLNRMILEENMLNFMKCYKNVSNLKSIQ